MPRRPKNIHKRGQMYYLVTRVGGKQVWRSLGTSVLSEARRLAPLIKDRLLEESGEVGDHTVESFIPVWWEEYATINLSRNWRYSVRKSIEKHVVPLLGKRLLHKVNSHDLYSLRASLESKDLAPDTVAGILSGFRSFMSYAVVCQQTEENPFNQTRVMPHLEEGAPRALSDDDIERIMSACPKKHRLTLELALSTGLRWSELMRLTWHHVKWHPRPHLLLEKTKSGKVRRVPLVGSIVDRLRQEKERTQSVTVLPQLVDSRTIRKSITRETGITFRIHDLRHTFATRYVERGGSLAMLQLILGHSSYRMTQRYARHTDEPMFADAERVLAEALAKPLAATKQGATEIP